MSVTQSASVFACYDRACAPPPAGKGGSLPRGTSGGRKASSGSRGGSAPSLELLQSHVSKKKGTSARTARIDGPNKKLLDFVAFKLGIVPMDSHAPQAKGKAVSAISRHLLKDKEFMDFVAKSMDKSPVGSVFKAIAERELKGTGKYWFGDPSTIRSIVKELKESIPDLSSMSDEEVVASLFAKGMVNQWAEDSTASPVAIAHHLAAAEVHGVDASKMLKFVGADLSRRGRATFADNRTMMLALARAEYAATQEILRQSGVKEVVLYRGMTYQQQVAVGDVVKNFMNPLSSWSLERDVAESFAGDPWAMSAIAKGDQFVTAMRVPVEQIQSFFASGRGCLVEFEFVLIGHPSEATVVDVIE